MLTPAAQYLRMSTEHQQYSFQNQSAAIQQYAEQHGFTVIQSYEDAGKSGLVLKHRAGLSQLLRDVVGGGVGYGAVLVYDVSRWGRFQDTDEAAHYEFLCKQAGVPVHYCAETFPNDGSLPSMIMKALKRTMAGEYSRELSVKVFEGQKRLVQNGFKMGGLPGYGLRRMLISADGTPKQLLRRGELKSIATDRVLLVPGPAEELAVVREIYRMVTEEKKKPSVIFRELNQRGIPYISGSRWTWDAVHEVLTNPKYVGCNAWGRTERKLSGPILRVAKQHWTVRPEAFTPIIDRKTFDAAQFVFADRTFNKTNEQIVDEIRALLARKGRLSETLVDECRSLPAASTIQYRFGGFQRLYELIGYRGTPEFNFRRNGLRKRTQGVRDGIVAKLEKMFPQELSVIRDNERSRPRLRLRSDITISVLMCRTVRTPLGHIRWKLDSVPVERKNITLLCLMNAANNAVSRYYVVPNINRETQFRLRPGDPWLKRGVRLRTLRELVSVV
jgi:DNA invertase Pin-like site-specific DNA recombinase